MNLTSALNSLLHHFYDSFAPPVQAGGSVSAHSFYEAIIVRALESPEFRERLLKEPEAVLAEAGISLPQGVRVQFVENTADVVHIVIPPYVGD